MITDSRGIKEARSNVMNLHANPFARYHYYALCRIEYLFFLHGFFHNTLRYFEVTAIMLMLLLNITHTDEVV